MFLQLKLSIFESIYFFFYVFMWNKSLARVSIIDTLNCKRSRKNGQLMLPTMSLNKNNIF